MKEKIIISVGHVCIDITPVIPAGISCTAPGELLIPGKLIHVDAADVHTGGSVANTGLALKILGNEVRLLGKIGKDAFGGMIKSIMAEFGAGGLIEDSSCDTSYSVVIAIPGIDRMFLHNPGANDTFRNSDIPDEALEGAALFHFGYPTLMRSMYADGGEELSGIFRRMKGKDIATGLDLSAVDTSSEAGRADWESILKKTLPYVDFFVPSFEEICFMLDRPLYERLNAAGGDMAENPDIMAYAERLAVRALSMGCRTVLIKCGVSGMYYKTGTAEVISGIGGRLELDTALWADKSGIQPCFRAEVVRSAAGAGDAAIAAYLAGIARGFGPEKCAALAAAEGACCVTSYDTLSGLKDIEGLEKMISAQTL